jgi:hypothetical protein
MDDGILYYLMGSYKHNYFEGWAYLNQVKVFYSTTYASPIIYLPIGFISKVLNIYPPMLKVKYLYSEDLFFRYSQLI